MKIRPIFAWQIGISLDRHRRVLMLACFVGVALELAGAVVQKALPLPSDVADEDLLASAISRFPTATWPELKAGLGGMGATRATLARGRLSSAGRIETRVVDVPNQGKRRVLALTAPKP